MESVGRLTRSRARAHQGPATPLGDATNVPTSIQSTKGTSRAKFAQGGAPSAQLFQENEAPATDGMSTKTGRAVEDESQTCKNGSAGMFEAPTSPVPVQPTIQVDDVQMCSPLQVDNVCRQSSESGFEVVGKTPFNSPALPHMTSSQPASFWADAVSGLSNATLATTPAAVPNSTPSNFPVVEFETADDREVTSPAVCPKETVVESPHWTLPSPGLVPAVSPTLGEAPPVVAAEGMFDGFRVAGGNVTSPGEPFGAAHEGALTSPELQPSAPMDGFVGFATLPTTEMSPSVKFGYIATCDAATPQVNLASPAVASPPTRFGLVPSGGSVVQADMRPGETPSFTPALAHTGNFPPGLGFTPATDLSPAIPPGYTPAPCFISTAPATSPGLATLLSPAPSAGNSTNVLPFATPASTEPLMEQQHGHNSTMDVQPGSNPCAVLASPGKTPFTVVSRPELPTATMSAKCLGFAQDTPAEPTSHAGHLANRVCTPYPAKSPEVDAAAEEDETRMDDTAEDAQVDDEMLPVDVCDASCTEEDEEALPEAFRAESGDDRWELHDQDPGVQFSEDETAYVPEDASSPTGVPAASPSYMKPTQASQARSTPQGSTALLGQAPGAAKNPSRSMPSLAVAGGPRATPRTRIQLPAATKAASSRTITTTAKAAGGMFLPRNVALNNDTGRVKSVVVVPEQHTDYDEYPRALSALKKDKALRKSANAGVAGANKVVDMSAVREPKRLLGYDSDDSGMEPEASAATESRVDKSDDVESSLLEAISSLNINRAVKPLKGLPMAPPGAHIVFNDDDEECNTATVAGPQPHDLKGMPNVPAGKHIRFLD